MQILTTLLLQTADPNGLKADAAGSAQPRDFLTPEVLRFCAVGVSILIVWLVWFGGFKALRRAPVRRNRLIGFEGVVLLFAWLLLMMGINMVIPLLFPSATFLFRQTLSYPAMALLEISLIAAIVMLARHTFARRLKGFGLNVRTVGPDAGLALVYLTAVYPLILLALWAVAAAGQFFRKDFSIEVHQSLTFLAENTHPAMTVLIVLFAAVIVPVFEEMLFRGLLQTTVRSWTHSPWTAILLTSLLFSILHPVTHIPALFVLSCGLGYAYERSGSLFRPILMHIFFNSVSIAATFWPGS